MVSYDFVLQHLPRPTRRRAWLGRHRGHRCRRGAWPFARQPRAGQRRHQSVGRRRLAQTRQTLTELLLGILQTGAEVISKVFGSIFNASGSGCGVCHHQ